MKVIYQGKNITDDVDVKRCIHKDVSGGQRDMLDIEFEYSDRWFGWQPQKDDAIRIELDGYDTGAMYVNTILPEHGRYRIIATAAKSAARRKCWASFENQSLQTIMDMCAAECGMSSGLYEVNGDFVYPYLTRCNEDSMSFIDRLLMLESARLKCLNGKLRGISIPYAQSLPPVQLIELDSTQLQAQYINRKDIRYASVTVRTPYGTAAAFDLGVGNGLNHTITTLPAADDLQAARWARGFLLHHNRQAEELHLGMEYNAGLTALARIDIKSDTDADGNWIIDEVEHDFIMLKSRAKLYRCITTIG